MTDAVHAPRTKDHALIFGPKNLRVIILNGHDPNRAADVETPICCIACAVAESISTRPRTKKAWSPKIGGNDIARGCAYSNPDRNVYLWNGASILEINHVIRRN